MIKNAVVRLEIKISCGITSLYIELAWFKINTSTRLKIIIFLCGTTPNRKVNKYMFRTSFDKFVTLVGGFISPVREVRGPYEVRFRCTSRATFYLKDTFASPPLELRNLWTIEMKNEK